MSTTNRSVMLARFICPIACLVLYGYTFPGEIRTVNPPSRVSVVAMANLPAITGGPYPVFIPVVLNQWEQGNLPKSVTATAETDPMSHDHDAADDPLIWIHPTDPSLSTVMGNDKHGLYEVYDLTGHRIQSLQADVNNTDLRYNFPLGNERVALVVSFNKTNRGMIAWKVNPETRKLEDVTSPGAILNYGGGALYHSQKSGNYYWFTNHQGILSQYQIFDDGTGKVTSRLVRTVKYGSSEGEMVVADDIRGFVYASELTVGLWRLSAEPDGGDAKYLVDKPVDQGGHFKPDLEGLAIYYKTDGTGYLLASSQGSDSFNIYKREGNNDYIGSFQIQDGSIDGVISTDGIDVTNLPLGNAFPYGVFVAQDGKNYDYGALVNQNFKLVPFERIAQMFNLTMDTPWDPRIVGR